MIPEESKDCKEGGAIKNGKTPTLRQKKMIRSHGMDPAEWLVTRDTPELIELVKRISLKAIGKPKTRVVMKGM